MDICIKVRNEEEIDKILKLNYKCAVYNKQINNLVTFIPDQYITDLNSIGNSIIISNNPKILEEAKSRNLKIAFKVDNITFNTLEYEYFVLEFIPKNKRDLRYFKGKIYVDNIDDLDIYNKLESLKIDGIFTNKVDFILLSKKLQMYKK
ncbi:MAG: hypothetical protein QXQ01_07675 [Saccharolobus sp.]